MHADNVTNGEVMAMQVEQASRNTERRLQERIRGLERDLTLVLDFLAGDFARWSAEVTEGINEIYDSLEGVRNDS